jgi:hypothetical protein
MRKSRKNKKNLQVVGTGTQAGEEKEAETIQR